MISLPTVGNDTTEPDVAALPLTPRNPLPYTRQFAAIRSFHTGTEVLRDAGGRWPPIVIASSPRRSAKF